MFLITAAAIVAWAVPRHPAYQEWHYSRMSLEQLQHERGEQTDDFRLLYHTGLRLNQRQRFEEALPLLLQAARLRPDEARIREALAQAQMPLGKTGEAFNQLAQFVGTHPASAEGHLQLGKFYLAMKSGEHAQKELERAVALDPQLAAGWAALADARFQFSVDKHAALEAARRAVQLRPNHPDGVLLLATLLANQYSPEARAAFERASALAPHRPDILQRYADYLMRTGAFADLSRAETAARQALALNANASLAHLTLGRALALRGAYTEAIEPLKRAAACDPYDPVAPYELSRLYTHLRQSSEAKSWQGIWLNRQTYQGKRQKLIDAAVAKPYDPTPCGQLAHLLAVHGEVTEAMHYQGLAQGRRADLPSVLIAVAKDLVDGGYEAQAALLARRALEITSEPALIASAKRLLARTERHGSNP